MTKTTESKWRDLIAEQERSGLTVRAFAECRGISAPTMYWWRCRLGRPRRANELVPVEIVEDDVVGGSRGTFAPGFELQIADALILRIPTGFDEGELLRLVRALRC